MKDPEREREMIVRKTRAPRPRFQARARTCAGGARSLAAATGGRPFSRLLRPALLALLPLFCQAQEDCIVVVAQTQHLQQHTKSTSPADVDRPPNMAGQRQPTADSSKRTRQLSLVADLQSHTPADTP